MLPENVQPEIGEPFTVTENNQFDFVEAADNFRHEMGSPEQAAVTENVQTGIGINERFLAAETNQSVEEASDSQAELDIKVEPTVIRLSHDDEQFLDIQLTEDEEEPEHDERIDERLTDDEDEPKQDERIDEQLTDDEDEPGQDERIDESTDAIIFVNLNGAEAVDVPQPLNTNTDGLVKRENDVISGNIAFRETVSKTTLL